MVSIIFVPYYEEYAKCMYVGILQPAEYTTAPLQDDEPEPDPKGKRKAPPL